MDIQLSAMRAFLDPTIYPAYMHVLVADHPQYRQLYAWVRGRWHHGNQASLLTDWKFRQCPASASELAAYATTDTARPSGQVSVLGRFVNYNM